MSELHCQLWREGWERRQTQTCGNPHSQNRFFSRRNDALPAEFGDEAERPRWAELLRSGVSIFDLDYDAILAAMYALSVSAEGGCYLCVPPNPGIEAAALGSSDSVLPGIVPAEALHTFTLDSGAYLYFFGDSTTLTPLSAPVPIRLADPSGGPVLARSSTVLPCPACPPGRDGHYHHSLGSTCVDLLVYTDGPPPGHVHSSGSCVCPGVRVRSGSTPLLVSPPVTPDSPLAPPPWSPLPATPSWHALPPPCLWSSQVSTSPPALACPNLPSFVEGRQRAAPHSSSFPSTTAPLQALHLDVWCPARVSGQGRDRYFLLVVEDYTRYAMVFPLCSKGQVPDVLIPWIRAVRLQLRERFRQDLPVLRRDSDRGGKFSCDLMRDFVVGREFSSLMEVSRTSMIHAAAPHFQWPFAVRYAAHQLNLWPRVSLPETSADTVLDGGGWRCVGVSEPLPPQGPAPSSVSQVDPLPGTVPVEVAVDSGAARGAVSGGAEPGGAEPRGAEPGGVESEGVLCQNVGIRDVVVRVVGVCVVELVVDSAVDGAVRVMVPLPDGLWSWGAERGGVESGVAEPVGVESGGAEPAGVEPGGSEPGGAEPRGTASSGDLAAARAGDSAARDTGVGGAGVAAGTGGIGGAAAAGPGGARTWGIRAAGTGGVGGAGAAGAGGTGPRGTSASGAGAGGYPPHDKSPVKGWTGRSWPNRSRSWRRTMQIEGIKTSETSPLPRKGKTVMYCV
ncbi:unnamed protein product [Closterium sp. NIES-54]